MLRHFIIKERKVIESVEGSGQIQVFINPDERERRQLIDELKLDEHTLGSVMDPDEISRVEFEPEHVALIYKHPKHYVAQDEFLFKISSAGLFLFKERLVIVLTEDAPVFEGKQFSRVQSLSDLVLKILYRAIVHFLQHLRVIAMMSDSLETKINTAMENSYLLNLFTLEKSMVYYLNAIHANGALIEKLKVVATKLGLTADELELLDDIMIENNQCLRQAEIYSNILASLMDARVSIVSNNLNMLMKTLNLITIGIMMPTLVVSAFSMNVAIPFQRHPYAFMIVMGMALLSLAGMFAFWRFKKW